MPKNLVCIFIDATEFAWMIWPWQEEMSSTLDIELMDNYGIADLLSSNNRHT